MKIFGWMKNNLNGEQVTKRPNSVPNNDQRLQEPYKEEFSDWPRGLLAIGTFGNNNVKEDPERCNLQDNQSSDQDHLQCARSEEIGELEKELKLVLHKQVSFDPHSEDDFDTDDLQLEKPFSWPYFEVDRSCGERFCDNYSEEEASHLHHSTNIAHSRGKDINTSNAISKKSLSLLLKKMFICRSGITPTPSLRDSLPETKIDKYSRMEKILRAVLHKRIYPQGSNPNATAKKYLENRHVSKSTDTEDEMLEKKNDGSKWVKTDSEFIVLEI